MTPAEKNKQWCRDNPEKYLLHLEQARKRRKTGCYKERDLEYYYAHREERLAYMREYVAKNRAEISRKALVKYHSNPSQNLRTRIMARLTESLKTKRPGRNKWLDTLGYSVDELKQHIESKFLDGMSWDNYGEWHIDHVIPIAAFNYSSIEDFDFKRCWALKNLQPLWANDNLRKSARISTPFQPSLAMG